MRPPVTSPVDVGGEALPWFDEFSADAARTDDLQNEPDQLHLLAAGFFGEIGDLLTEAKKSRRDRDSYPEYREKLLEEMGDALWYLARCTEILSPGLAPTAVPLEAGIGDTPNLSSLMHLGQLSGQFLGELREVECQVQTLWELWAHLQRVAIGLGVDLKRAAQHNQVKRASRWPRERRPHPLFDQGYGETEQLPRRLHIEFRQRKGSPDVVTLRCNGLNFGDRLSDNIEEPDWYRFHDVFHFAHAVYVGWSPVLRALLRTKRKSNSQVDEAQDGARAIIVEEAVSAMVFSRAKRLGFFDGIDTVDYSLLKGIQQVVRGYEVQAVPLWQWEEAILEGYRVFRRLRDHCGGHVELDLEARSLKYQVTVP